jgi:magnesium-transporting ATPase (P-type)
VQTESAVSSTSTRQLTLFVSHRKKRCGQNDDVNATLTRPVRREPTWGDVLESAGREVFHVIDCLLEQFWRVSTQALFERLSTSPEGLSQNGAEERLARYGPNTLAEPPRLDIVRKIGRRFTEPLVAILLVAAAISGATDDLGSFAIIVTVIVLSIALDLFQEPGRTRRRGLETFGRGTC